jgi:hypothetical protein
MRFFRSATWPSIWKARGSFGLVRSPALAATCWESMGFGTAPQVSTLKIWRAQSERTILPKCALARMCVDLAACESS